MFLFFMVPEFSWREGGEREERERGREGGREERGERGERREGGREGGREHSYFSCLFLPSNKGLNRFAFVVCT